MPKQIARILKATMMICGMYNESGHRQYTLDCPQKAVWAGELIGSTRKMGIGIFGPVSTGRYSVAGLALLEKISRYLDVSIF